LAESHASSIASEAALEASALRAELYYSSVQKMLDESKAKAKNSELVSMWRRKDQENVLIKAEMRESKKEIVNLKAQVETLMAQAKQEASAREAAESAHNATSTEFSEFRAYVSSSASRSTAGVGLDSIIKFQITEEPSPVDSPVPAIQSPARMKRETIGKMSDDEILAMALGLEGKLADGLSPYSSSRKSEWQKSTNVLLTVSDGCIPKLPSSSASEVA